MKIPNFLYEEFVDDGVFNNAMTVLQNSIIETGSNGTFLLAGVINGASLIFSFTINSLVVGVTTPNTGSNPFRCLFNSGVITSGHGIVNGLDIQTYSVDFTTLVPIAGSITAYIVAQETTVLESPTTIIGAPPGHPDYSPNFVPNIGYSVIQDTLNIFVTTTVPDNLSTIELARTTLVAGQTSISSVDTTHQVPAIVNAKVVTLAGDVTGPSDGNIISFLQGNPVAASTPAPNSVFNFNGVDWVAAVFGGDITGPIGSTNISKLQGKPVSAGAPAAGQVLEFNGIAWVPSNSLPPTGPASGDLAGNYPDPIVVGIEDIPINGVPTATGQVPTYSLSANKFNWVAQSLGLVYTKSLGSPVALNPDSPTAVLTSVSITLPATNGWRIICTYTCAIQGHNDSNAQRIFSYLTDNHGNQFGEQMQNPYGSGYESGFSNGFDVSAFYAGGTSVIITLNALAGNGGGTPYAVPTTQGIAGGSTIMVPTELTLILIPASG